MIYVTNTTFFVDNNTVSSEHKYIASHINMKYRNKLSPSSFWIFHSIHVSLSLSRFQVSSFRLSISPSLPLFFTRRFLQQYFPSCGCSCIFQYADIPQPFQPQTFCVFDTISPTSFIHHYIHTVCLIRVFYITVSIFLPLVFISTSSYL